MDNCITVRGKSYPVAMTVQAFAEIGDLCPGKDIQRLGELSSMPTGESMIIISKMAAAMSRAAENKRRFEEPGYKPDPLQIDAILTLSMEEYQEVASGLIKAMTAGLAGRTVEVSRQEVKKKRGRKRQNRTEFSMVSFLRKNAAYGQA